MSGAAPGRRLRLLFLLPFAPRRDARHGGKAIAHVLAELASRHEVALLHLRDGDEPPIEADIAGRCDVVEEVVLPRARDAHRLAHLARLILAAAAGRPMQATEGWSRVYAARAVDVARSWRPDVAHAEMHVMAQYFAALRGCAAAMVLSVHEPAPTREFFATAAGVERALRRLDAHAWRRFERRVVAQADAIVAFTEDDAAVMRDIAPRAAVAAIPLHVPVPAAPLDPLGAAPPSVLFVGGLRHPPNIDAAYRLASEIFPRVRADAPTATLAIVGADAPELLRARAGPGVTVTGGVPDVTPFLERAAVFVAPLRLGGGMRVKVLEALGAGKAVVASRLAVRGLDVVDRAHVLLADTDRDFADAILRVLASPRLRLELATAARAWSLARAAGLRTVAAYEDLYRRALATRARRGSG